MNKTIRSGAGCKDEQGLVTSSGARLLSRVRALGRFVPLFVGGIVAGLGWVVLAGWFFDLPVLKSVLPDWIAMKANTALGLVAAGLAVALVAGGFSSPAVRRIVMALAALAAGLGVLTLAEYLFGVDLGIDQMLFADRDTAGQVTHAGRMAPASALCLVLVGAALLAGCLPATSRFRLPCLRALGTSVAVIGCFALVGYLVDVVFGYRGWNYTGMAMHTALAMTGLGLAVLLLGRGGPGWALGRGTTAAFVAGIALMLTVVNISFHFTQKLKDTAALVTHRQEVLREIQEVMAGAIRVQSNQRGYVVTGDPHFLEQRRNAAAALRRDVGDIRTLTADNPSQQRNVAALAALSEELLRRDEPESVTGRDRGGADPGQMATTGAGAELWNREQELIRRMQQEEYALLALDQERAEMASKLAFLLLPLGIFLSLTILLLALFFLNAGVAERGRVEEALRESEHRYRELVEMAPTPIFVNRGNRIVFINGAGLRLLRASGPEQVVGCRPQEIFHPESHPLVAERIGLLLREPQTVPPVEEKIVTMDGAIVPVEVTAASYRSDGELVIQVVCRDITERKRAEAQIQALNADLERRVAQRTAELVATNKELDAFCYAVSHDLRGPLRAIAGFTRILAESHGETLDATARGYFDRVLAATERMGQLIDDLLNLSRVTREEFRRETVDLSALGRDIAADLRRGEPLREVEFVIAEGLKGQGDARLLRIMLENLLGNAWKFTSRKLAPRIEFGAASYGEEGRFFVRDNGAGFDMRYAGKLFGAFQRLHGLGEFPGTGIGLATVQRIINRHGGRVWAEAEVERGATFFFTL